MVVALGETRKFPRPTKPANPESLDTENPVAPATFLVTSGFWQDTRGANQAGSGFTSYERILHRAQEFIFHGEPPRAGTALTVQARPGPSYEKTGRRGGVMKFHESVTEYRDE